MKYFNTGELTPEERSRLRLAIQQLGLWGLTVPEEFGGGGLDVITSCVVEEELGGTFIPVDMGEVPAMLYACNEEQTAQYLEPALEAGRQAIIAAREPGPQAVQPEAGKPPLIWMATNTFLMARKHWRRLPPPRISL